jgi:hypothetical protein
MEQNFGPHMEQKCAVFAPGGGQGLVVVGAGGGVALGQVGGVRGVPARDDCSGPARELIGDLGTGLGVRPRPTGKPNSGGP